MINNLVEEVLSLRDQSERKAGDLVTMLGMMVEQQRKQRQVIGSMHEQIQAIAEMVSAPKEILQDPKTGKKIVRRVQNG